MRNSLGDFEATRDSEIRFSEEVVGKLGEIANVMRDGNQAVRNNAPKGSGRLVLWATKIISDIFGHFSNPPLPVTFYLLK